MKHTFHNKVEFYITNVCNLTCDNCNRFNNYKFTGWQRWEDYIEVYTKWADYINLPQIVIMGGEPLLNPTVNQWIQGLHQIFGAHIQVLSNGIQLNKAKDLYQTLVDNNGHVGISLHNLDHFEQIRANIKDFLGPIKEEYGAGTADNRANGIFYSARDVNEMLVNVYMSNDFQQAAVIAKPDGGYTLHNSNPENAHGMCGFVLNKCYHFIKGKIYKCGPVALIPEFDQQFNLDISDQDRALLNSYKPMTVDTWPSDGQQWIAELDNVIPQCKFCPDYVKMTKIFPVVKSARAITV